MINQKNVEIEQTNKLQIPAHEADLLRHCPHCKSYHMVNNRKRDYCSDWCADTHYNQKRRLDKQATNNSALENYDYNIKPQTQEQSALPTANISHESLHEIQTSINLKILNTLTIQSNKGSLFYIEPLAKMGLTFPGFTYRGKLNNTPAGTDSYYLQLKNYRIYLITNTTLLIAKI